MKKILKVLGVFLIGFLVLFSCEKPKPDCEIEGYGWSKVENSTGYRAKVDVTYTVDGINNETWINSGSSVEYRMYEGKIYIWISFDGDDWVYDIYYLESCEELSYRWYLDKKKSSSDNWWENYEVVYVDNNGEEVHRSEFTHYGSRK
jgi:hypothetical protein